MFFVAAALLVSTAGVGHQTQPGRALDAGHLPAPGSYSVPAEDSQAAWIVNGAGFSLDLTARILNGSGSNGAQQEKYSGVGLLVDGAKDVTIKNLEVSGYRQNIVLRNCENVRILNCKVSHSRAIRMGTPLELRNLDVWKTYGAGIWLEKCKGCRIENCTATDAQNGIALVDTTGTTVYANDCSYNGGWGIALWKSPHNSILWNHADFCNRQGGAGWGGDSAGIIAVNGCTKNLLVANSMTHCGDGLVLTDQSNGGFNKLTQKYEIKGDSPLNTIAYCDASWASGNAFASTFSKGNVFYKNVADTSTCGFWLGFSGFSLLMENHIVGNKTDGVAIPQGAGNLLFRNVIEKDGSAGIHIWSDKGPARTDKPALKNVIVLNRIADCPTAIAQELAVATDFQSNTIERAATPPGFQQKGPDFALLERASSYVGTPDGRAITEAYSHRPANWRFYSETSGPKGADALKAGDYSPRKA